MKFILLGMVVSTVAVYGLSPTLADRVRELHASTCPETCRNVVHDLASFLDQEERIKVHADALAPHLDVFPNIIHLSAGPNGTLRPELLLPGSAQDANQWLKWWLGLAILATSGANTVWYAELEPTLIHLMNEPIPVGLNLKEKLALRYVADRVLKRYFLSASTEALEKLSSLDGGRFASLEARIGLILARDLDTLPVQKKLYEILVRRLPDPKDPGRSYALGRRSVAMKALARLRNKITDVQLRRDLRWQLRHYYREGFDKEALKALSSLRIHLSRVRFPTRCVEWLAHGPLLPRFLKE